MIENIHRDDYRIDFEDRSSYLFAHIIGERGTLSIARRYWLDIIEVVMRSEFRKILVVEEIPEAIEISEVHQLVTELAQLPLPVRDLQLAFVDLFDQHKSLNNFGVLVAENRGLSLRQFDSEAQAETWLIGGHATPPLGEQIPLPNH
jgi:hypothetical protein